jgi:colanic acid biosynthesis glycosyl transferase WcaI
MKILVYGINYHPELTGIGKYTGEMCAWLAAQGHQVEVITAMPYYPQWKIDDQYVDKKWFTETVQQVKVRRSPLFVSQKVNSKNRIIHEFSFLLSSKLHWIASLFRKYDVVISIYPPLIVGVFPLLYRLIHRKPWVFHIQDLQVDAAKELGMIKNKFILNTLFRIEKFFLRKSTRISSISPGMKKKILNKGFPESKYLNLPNWVDTVFIRPMPVEQSLRSRLGFGLEEKIVLYSGNLGEKQGLEIIIQAAELLQNIGNLRIVIAGEGAAKRRLEELTKNKQLKNIYFMSLMPYQDLPAFLNMADIHLVLQKKEASDLVLPSKLCSILSVGGVSVVSALEDTTLYNLVKDNNLGMVIEPESATALANAINELIDSSPIEQIKINARNYALQNLSIGQILGNFEEELKSLIKNS